MENCFEKIGRLEDKKVSHLKGNKVIREWGNKFISKAILVKYYLNRFIKELIPLFTYSPIHFKKAFTLAEVLITLGIIGVVAALTMPTLISKHNANVTVNKLKKFYSVMSQATNMAVNEYGPMEDWDGFTSSFNSEEMQAWFDKYIKPYIKVTKEEIKDVIGNDGEIIFENGFFVYLSDGSVLRILNYSANTPALDENGVDQNHVSSGWNGYIHLYYYTSEKALKNHVNCRNQFVFLFHDQLNQRYGFSPYNNWVLSSKVNLSRESRIQYVKENKQLCAGLLMYDNWQVKDDYPSKF